jgi:xylulokinase
LAQRLVAGVDCSTQATKVIVLDADSGQVVASTRAPHRVTGVAGARETDPGDWYDALAAALRATGHAHDLEAISIAAQQHGLVVLGPDGAPLRPAILWNDTRAVADSRTLIAQLGGPAAATKVIGSLPGPAFTVCSWAWLRRTEPEAAREASAIRLPHDWLTELLTGEAVTDRGDVSATGWWSTPSGEYLSEVLDLPAVRLRASMLPRVLGPDEPAGRVCSAAAEQLGLRPGIPVGPGTGDNPATALGLGLRAGVPVVSLGTSGTVFTVSATPSADPGGTVVGLADATGRYLPLACTLNCTMAVDRIAGWLGIDRDQIAPSSAGVVALPYLDGERTPDLPHAAGSITGLRHTTEPGQILRAAYEGAVASLLGALDIIHANSSGIDADAPLVLAGGGSRGSAWRECVAALSGRAIRIAQAAEPAALGAAFQAVAVLEGRDVDGVARAWGQVGPPVLAPRPVDQAALDRISQIRADLTALNERTHSAAR